MGEGESITIAEDTSGEVQAYIAVSDQYWGTNNLCQIYDQKGNLMPGSDGIFADPKAKSIAVKRPGNNGQYLLFTRGIDQKIYYHIIDMSLPGNGTTALPLGDVVLKQQPLNAAAVLNYGRHLAAVEDHLNDKVILYATRYTDATTGLGSTDLVSFTIGNQTQVTALEKVQESYPSYDPNGEGDIQISPDGKALVVYNHKEEVGWTAQQLAELRVYDVASDYSLLTQAGRQNSRVLSIDRGTIPSSRLDLSGASKYVYYTQKEIAYNISPTSYEAVYREKLIGSTPELIKADIYGDLRRGKDKNVYTANNSTSIDSYKEDPLGNVLEDAGKVITLGNSSTGALPLQVHRVYDRMSPIEAIYCRLLGKKDYELKDHLGDVTVVVGDNKEAITSASLVTGYEAYVQTYTHYYAFGVGMPSRSYSSGSYRYGFNGKEKDQEGLGGGGSTYDYGFRIYNPQIAKFLSLDPLFRSYPWYTPYQFAGNNPIKYIDLDGLEKWLLKINFGGKLIIPIANWSYIKYNTTKMVGLSLGIASDDIGTEIGSIFRMAPNKGLLNFRPTKFTYKASFSKDLNKPVDDATSAAAATVTMIYKTAKAEAVPKGEEEKKVDAAVNIQGSQAYPDVNLQREDNIVSAHN